MSMLTDKMESNPIDLEGVITLAQSDTEKGWKKIDTLLPQASQQDDFFNWAEGNLDNQESGLCDLAASILEKTEKELESDTIENLFVLIERSDEENPYPSFRAACALAKRFKLSIVSPRLSLVSDKLREFLNDPDVKDIASDYLKEMGAYTHLEP